MKKDEIISMLQQQNAFLQQQLREANDRLMEANRKVDELLRKVSSLEELLVRKNQEEQKQRNVIKGLTKIQQNKSEKQTPAASACKEEQKQEEPKAGRGPTTEPDARITTRWRSRRRISSPRILASTR